MTPIICLTGTHNIGISFLDWSLHWLSGNTEVYHWQHGWQPLTSNPLTAQNAHRHVRNHVSGITTTRQVIDRLMLVPAAFHTLYPVGPAVDQRARELGHDHTVIKNNNKWQEIIDMCDQEYAQVWRYCDYMGCDCVFVATEASNQVYHAHTLDRAQHAVMFAEHAEPDTFLRMHELFFQDSLAQATTTWDRRELLALNLQWHTTRLGHEHLDFSLPHHWINCRELWYHGAELLPRLMQQLDIKLDQSRYAHWLEVYQRWQQINYRFLQFQYELDHIIEATVKGWHYPLLNLSFLQEVIIQHHLIYQHNLNIKNWQLERFPDNTQKLHQLLEINHHQLRSTA